MAVSLRPSSFSVGSGLIDDADVEIVRARFTVGYGENSSSDATTLLLMLKDGEDVEHAQYYSTGQGFVPSEDPKNPDNSGKEMVPVGDKTSPSGSSNMAILINSLVNAGLPEDLLDSGDISALEGVKGHVNRIPAPKRDNLPKREGKNADRPQTVLVFTTVSSLPGQAPAKTAAKPKPGASQAKPAPAPAKGGGGDEVSEDLKEELTGLLLEFVTDTPITKVKMIQELFKAAKESPNKKELVSIAGKEEVLSSLEVFEFDGKSIKLA